MGITYLPIKITNPQNGGKTMQRKMLVDSGSVYSILPSKDLYKLGIKPDSRQKFILGNGKEMEKDVGEARFMWKGVKRTAPVVFGDEKVYVLGVTTLEVMGVILNPIDRKLEKLLMTL